MAKDKHEKEENIVQDTPETGTPETGLPKTGPESTEEPNPLLGELEALKTALAEQENQYLRLAAEYDNFRKRSTREKSAAYADAQADATLSFLPVYDNLERALKQETADKAYAKGVEMTFSQLKAILEKLNIQEIPAVGQPFDPALHNAIMHVEDDTVGSNIITEVFQTGFKLGDKIIRVAMVKVAN